MQPQPSIVTPHTKRLVSGALGIGFLFMFAIWEALNYWTTEAGAAMWMGIPTEQIGWTMASPGWWIRYLAVVMVGLDVFHLIIFFIDRLIPGVVPDEANALTWAAWGIVTLADMALSVFTFGYQFEVGVMSGTTRGPQVFQSFLQYAPFVMAAMTWGMTFFMVSAGRSFLASAFGLPPRPPKIPALYVPRGGNGPQGGGGKPNQPPPQQQKPQQPPPRQAQFRPPAQPSFHPVGQQSGGNTRPVDPAVQKVLDEFHVEMGKGAGRQ